MAEDIGITIAATLIIGLCALVVYLSKRQPKAVSVHDRPTLPSIELPLEVKAAKLAAYATQAELDALVTQVTSFFNGQRKTDYEQKVTDIMQDVLTDLNAWCVQKQGRSMIPRYTYKTRNNGRNKLRWEQMDERKMFFDVIGRLKTALAPIDAVDSVGVDTDAFSDTQRDLVIAVEFKR